MPLIGARRRDRLDEALGALDVKLSADDLAAIERAVPKGAAAGERYNSQGMATLIASGDERAERNVAATLGLTGRKAIHGPWSTMRW